MRNNTHTRPNSDLFSYAALSREDEASAREDATLIRSHVEDIAKKGIEIGQALNRQKGKMGHGLFMAWVRDECGMSQTVANKLMRVAREIGSKYPTSGTLLASRLGPDALDILVSSTTPESVRTAVEELLVDGEKVTVADIKKMKEEAKAAESTGSGSARHRCRKQSHSPCFLFLEGESLQLTREHLVAVMRHKGDATAVADELGLSYRLARQIVASAKAAAAKGEPIKRKLLPYQRAIAAAEALMAEYDRENAEESSGHVGK